MAVEKTEEELKEEADFVLVRKNAVAIGETLVHHGKTMTELFENNQQLGREVAMLKQELAAQKQLIIKSLHRKYGHGATA